MAKKRRWSRYAPPREPSEEEGRPEASPPAAAAATEQLIPTGCAALVVALIVLAVVALVLAFVVGSSGRDDDADDADDTGAADGQVSASVSTQTLDVAFVERGLRNGAAHLPGSDPFGVYLDGSGMYVEFYVAATDAVHRVRTSPRDADYAVSVETDHVGFAPTSFDLDLVRPDVLVASAEHALGLAKDPSWWFEVMEVDRDTSEVTIRTHVSGEEDIWVDTRPDGTVIDNGLR